MGSRCNPRPPSGQLPAELGAAVLEAARAAFVHGMQLTSGIAAVVAVGLAILTAVLPRNLGAPPRLTEPASDALAPPEGVAHIAPVRLGGGAEG